MNFENNVAMCQLITYEFCLLFYSNKMMRLRRSEWMKNEWYFPERYYKIIRNRLKFKN